MMNIMNMLKTDYNIRVYYLKGPFGNNYRGRWKISKNAQN